MDDLDTLEHGILKATRECGSTMTEIAPSREARDLGCTIVDSLRVGPLAAVFRGTFDHPCVHRVEEKQYPVHVINVTLRGEWEFHGRGRAAQLSEHSVMTGTAGEWYGCGHDPRYANENLIACLNREALDPDTTNLFKAQVFVDPMIARQVRRALTCESLDAFESAVFEIFEHTSQRSWRGSQRPHRDRLRMQRVKRFIELHATEDIDLKGVSEVAGLNPYVCLRAFKRSFGMTPHAYRSEIRIAEAKRLLSNKGAIVEEVARLAGYADPAYFSRFFRRRVGVAPSTYRDFA